MINIDFGVDVNIDNGFTLSYIFLYFNNGCDVTIFHTAYDSTVLFTYLLICDKILS